MMLHSMADFLEETIVLGRETTFTNGLKLYPLELEAPKERTFSNTPIKFTPDLLAGEVLVTGKVAYMILRLVGNLGLMLITTRKFKNYAVVLDLGEKSDGYWLCGSFDEKVTPTEIIHEFASHVRAVFVALPASGWEYKGNNALCLEKS